MLRFIGIYPVAILLAVLVASYVSKFAPMPQQARANAPATQTYVARQAQNFGAVTQDIPGDRAGQYATTAQIEGHDLQMLVDTGATYVALTSEDAGALGIKPSPDQFTMRMQTANGISSAARIWLPRVRIGAIEVHDVEAIVMAPGATNVNLLGMSFLSKLHRYGVSGNQLKLEQ